MLVEIAERPEQTDQAEIADAEHGGERNDTDSVDAERATDGDVAVVDAPIAEVGLAEADACADDDAVFTRDEGSLRVKLEALLFIASESLPLERLVALTKSTPELVTTTIAELEEEYADRGITVRLIAGGYRFVTAPRARSVVEAYLLPPKTSLSPAALETLAIIAYSQPITKAEIEAIRGVSVDGLVSNLQERGFLTELGRKESLGKPVLWGTTPQFLEAFGLGSLSDLPPLPEDQAERLATETAPAELLEGTVAVAEDATERNNAADGDTHGAHCDAAGIGDEAVAGMGAVVSDVVVEDGDAMGDVVEDEVNKSDDEYAHSEGAADDPLDAALNVLRDARERFEREQHNEKSDAYLDGVEAVSEADVHAEDDDVAHNDVAHNDAHAQNVAE